MEQQQNGFKNNDTQNICKGTNGLNNENNTMSNGSCEIRNSDSWEEITIEVPWGVVAGKWWGARDKQPILAMHGWQDNCGSFDPLCALMPAEIPVLAIDSPGHGKSSPYPKGMQYFLFWDGICLIRRIVRQFNWKNVTLMGHSMGGILTFMYAASFPDEVDKLINFDIAGPPVRGVINVDKSGWAIDKYLDYENLPATKVPCYTYDEMIEIVLDAYNGAVDLPAVKILMKRGMSPAPKHLHKNGYHFVRDLRLKVSFLGMFSKEQVLAYAERIKCKVLNIRAEPSNRIEIGYIYDEVIAAMQKNAALVVYEKVPGTHHLHLVTPERVAPHVNKFLLET